MRWRVEPHALRSVPLDSFTAVYHRASGQTHLLVEPAPEILKALVEPLSEVELRDRLSALYDLAGDGDALSARLRELADVGLIAPA